MIIGITGKMGSGKDTIGKIIQYLIVKTRENSIIATEGAYSPTSLEDFEAFCKCDTDTQSNWQIVKFADALKDIVCILIGCTREQLEDRDFKEKELGEEWWFYTTSLFTMRMLPYTEHKEELDNDLTYYIIKLTPRILLQQLGTDLIRNQLHKNTWINALMSKYKIDSSVDSTNREHSNIVYPNWIITDCRFQNEVEAVKRRGGIVIRTNRGNTTDKGELNPHTSETALDDAEFDYVIDNNGTIEELIIKVKEILIKENIL